MAPIGYDEGCSLLGKPSYTNRSVFDDDYVDPDEPNYDEMSALDDDYVREGYRDTEL